MKRISLFSGGLLGALSAVIVVALVYLGEQLAGFPFVPFDIFDWMTRILPGGLITFVVDTIVRVITSLGLGPTAAVAKQVELSIALVQFILAGAVFGIVMVAIDRRWPANLVSLGGLGGLLLYLPLVFVELSLGFSTPGPLGALIWLAIVFVSWGAVLGGVIREIASVPDPGLVPGVSRRQFLYLVGAGTFTVLVTALGISLLPAKNEIPQTG